jgi:tetratricopeptide (TPR) repeat protein
MTPKVGIQLPALAGLDAGVASQLREAFDDWQQAGLSGQELTQQAKLAGQLGMVALAYAQYQLAGDALDWAARSDPENFRWRYLSALSARSAGDKDAAILHLNAAATLAPDDLPIRLLLADLLLEQQRLEEASRLLGPSLEGESAALLGVRGRLALARKDYAAASQWLQSALLLEPQASRLQYPLGLALRGLGDEDAARLAISRRGNVAASVRDPLLAEVSALASGARVLEKAAGKASASGDFAQAIVLYRAALEKADEPQIRLNLGISMARLGQVAAAEGEFRQVLAAEPENAPAHFALGSVLAMQGRDVDAVQSYQQALKIFPRDPDTWMNLANAWSRLGRFEQAEDAYAQVIAIDPARAEARLGQSIMLIELRRWQAARASLQAGLQVTPGRSGLEAMLARLLAAAPEAEIRDGARALTLAEGLYAREQNLLHAEVLAQALAEVGRYTEAAQLQQQLIAAARTQKQPDLAKRLQANLDRYAAGKPSRMGQ